MSFYGDRNYRVADDRTDKVGIRTLVMSMQWAPTREGLSQSEIEAETPQPPPTSGGVLLIGQQTMQNPGLFKTLWTFEGIQGDGSAVTFRDRSNSFDYGFEPGFSQAPIMLHPDFLQLLTDYSGIYRPIEGDVIWSPTLGNSTTKRGTSTSKASKTNPMFGIQDYLRMEGTYRFRYVSLSEPTLTGLGMVSGGLPGKPPKVDTDRNWLFAAAPYRRRGLVYEVTEIYWLSKPGGWPAPIYGDGKNGNSGLSTTGGATSLGTPGATVGGALTTGSL